MSNLNDLASKLGTVPMYCLDGYSCILVNTSSESGMKLGEELSDRAAVSLQSVNEGLDIICWCFCVGSGSREDAGGGEA